LEFQEGRPFGLTGFFIDDNFGKFELAIPSEELVKIFFLDVNRQVSDKYFRGDVLLNLRLGLLLSGVLDLLLCLDFLNLIVLKLFSLLLKVRLIILVLLFYFFILLLFVF
jgi:hypothetical protein